jgi:hypothetical protein
MLKTVLRNVVIVGLGKLVTLLLVCVTLAASLVMNHLTVYVLILSGEYRNVKRNVDFAMLQLAATLRLASVCMVVVLGTPQNSAMKLVRQDFLEKTVELRVDTALTIQHVTLYMEVVLPDVKEIYDHQNVFVRKIHIKTLAYRVETVPTAPNVMQIQVNVVLVVNLDIDNLCVYADQKNGERPAQTNVAVVRTMKIVI